MTRIAIISDLHTTGKGKNKRLLSEAFDAVKELGADLVLSAGDNVNGCRREEYETLTASVKNHLEGIPLFCAVGNHDYFSNNPGDVSDEKARKAFLKNLIEQSETANRFQDGAYSVFFGKTHIIFLDCIQNRKNFLFTEEQAKWLESELEKSKKNQLRIIVNHLPLAAHNMGTQKKGRPFMAGNNRLQSIIDNNSNIIYISGHTHNRIDSDCPSAEQDEKGNIYLNGGSVGNTQPCIIDTRRLKALRNSLPKDSEEYKDINRYFKMGSMGLFLEINENTVRVRGYDFGRKEYISRCDFTFSGKHLSD